MKRQVPLGLLAAAIAGTAGGAGVVLAVIAFSTHTPSPPVAIHQVDVVASPTPDVTSPPSPDPTPSPIAPPIAPPTAAPTAAPTAPPAAAPAPTAAPAPATAAPTPPPPPPPLPVFQGATGAYENGPGQIHWHVNATGTGSVSVAYSVGPEGSANIVVGPTGSLDIYCRGVEPQTFGGQYLLKRVVITDANGSTTANPNTTVVVPFGNQQVLGQTPLKCQTVSF